MSPTDEVLGRFAAVGDDLLDDSPGHAGGEGGGGHQAIHQFVPFPSGHDQHHGPFAHKMQKICPITGRRVVKMTATGPSPGLSPGSSRSHPDWCSISGRPPPTGQARTDRITGDGAHPVRCEAAAVGVDGDRHPGTGRVVETEEVDPALGHRAVVDGTGRDDLPRRHVQVGHQSGKCRPDHHVGSLQRPGRNRLVEAGIATHRQRRRPGGHQGAGKTGPGRYGSIEVGADGSHRCGQGATAVVGAVPRASVVVGWTAPVAPPQAAPVTASAPHHQRCPPPGPRPGVGAGLSYRCCSEERTCSLCEYEWAPTSVDSPPGRPGRAGWNTLVPPSPLMKMSTRPSLVRSTGDDE